MYRKYPNCVVFKGIRVVFFSSLTVGLFSSCEFALAKTTGGQPLTPDQVNRLIQAEGIKKANNLAPVNPALSADQQADKAASDVNKATQASKDNLDLQRKQKEGWNNKAAEYQKQAQQIQKEIDAKVKAGEDPTQKTEELVKALENEKKAKQNAKEIGEKEEETKKEILEEIAEKKSLEGVKKAGQDGVGESRPDINGKDNRQNLGMNENKADFPGSSTNENFNPPPEGFKGEERVNPISNEQVAKIPSDPNPIVNGEPSVGGEPLSQLPSGSQTIGGEPIEHLPESSGGIAEKVAAAEQAKITPEVSSNPAHIDPHPVVNGEPTVGGEPLSKLPPGSQTIGGEPIEHLPASSGGIAEKVAAAEQAKITPEVSTKPSQIDPHPVVNGEPTVGGEPLSKLPPGSQTIGGEPIEHLPGSSGGIAEKVAAAQSVPEANPNAQAQGPSGSQSTTGNKPAEQQFKTWQPEGTSAQVRVPENFAKEYADLYKAGNGKIAANDMARMGVQVQDAQGNWQNYSGIINGKHTFGTPWEPMAGSTQSQVLSWNGASQGNPAGLGTLYGRDNNWTTNVPSQSASKVTTNGTTGAFNPIMVTPANRLTVCNKLGCGK